MNLAQMFLFVAVFFFCCALGLFGCYFRVNQLSQVKVVRPSIFVGTPSVFESLILKQIDFYCKNIITHVLLITGT